MIENLTVIITTKNRSESLRSLLNDLSTICEYLKSSFFSLLIVDDSHELAQIQQNEQVIASFTFTTIHHFNSLTAEITEKSQDRVYSSYSTNSGLGRKEWDASRPKFKGISEFLKNPLFSESDSVLLLDDDIRLRSSNYHSHFLKLDDEKIIDELFAYIPTDKLYARGTSYVGRVDACTDITISHLFSSKHSSSNFKTHKGVPTYRSWFSKIPLECCDESPGISGACLATNRKSLAGILLPPFYNEDWIWLELLKREGGLIERISEPVIHAGDMLVTYNQSLHVKQIEGDIVHSYFREIDSHSLTEMDDNLFAVITNEYLEYIELNALTYKNILSQSKVLKHNSAAKDLVAKYESLRLLFHKSYLQKIKEKIASYLKDNQLYKNYLDEALAVKVSEDNIQ